MGKRGRPCTVCQHSKREEIDKMLVPSDANFEGISRIFAELTGDALRRHKEGGHIADLLLKSQDAKDALQADNTFAEYQRAKARIEALQTRTYDLLGKAEAAENHNACIGYIRECRGMESELREQRKLLAELEGRLATQPTINVLVLPEWISLQNLIVNTLKPYPEALEAVRNALPRT